MVGWWDGWLVGWLVGVLRRADGRLWRSAAAKTSLDDHRMRMARRRIEPRVSRKRVARLPVDAIRRRRNPIWNGISPHGVELRGAAISPWAELASRDASEHQVDRLGERVAHRRRPMLIWSDAVMWCTIQFEGLKPPRPMIVRRGPTLGPPSVIHKDTSDLKGRSTRRRKQASRQAPTSELLSESDGDSASRPPS